ncbi:MAG: Grx4 family monothiol glutaredoxin [Deltaproteobacteria bacterium]|nr:Grx4 family monothiol glutaredoxin [Deltaproteobacteria bacterium]
MLDAQTKDRIESAIRDNDVVLFMKGNRAMPQCGFSGKVVQMLDSLLDDYATVDVLSDPDIRDGIKEYSSWPTIPQLYLKGEFVGGCDIVTELYATGELHEKLGLAVPERKIPTVHITDAAAKRIKEYLDRSPGKDLKLTIDARFNASMGLAPRGDHDVVSQANGIDVCLDVSSAERADGVTIDVVESATGAAFKIDNPNLPGEVKQITPAEVKQLIDNGTAFQFLDVRTPEEREIAAIAGTTLVDQRIAAEIEKLPKDTMLVLHCHHGGRSQAAAEHFRSKGFTNVHNMAGGIDAWSRDVDGSVPRY